ncbi:hypothetical protein HO133_009075 [Letharia lupina]|uniref:Uncharacterized protein n=1 Tax=Letharia lupina TaxID=560253 RepID=A0A8H6CMZ3_9LECA|nr:uncharacterized protein HO133_009075 [Letharia lupina]KAF6226209.1 hypothetical protein HO133_009075 [Letharia lupina]
MATENDTLPLLPPPANDDPPSFDSHPEFYAPAARQRTRLQSAPNLPPTDSSPRGSPTNPFRPPQNNLNQQSQDTDAYTPAKYRGHATEEEYLAALRAWAEEKLYTQPADKSTLVGFYGAETMKERIARQPPPLKMRIGRKRKESRADESAVRERQGAQEDEMVDGEIARERGNGEGEGRRRRSSLGNWLSRKRTN